jgi:hypothetical protein
LRPQGTLGLFINTVPDRARLPQWAIDGYLEVTQQSAEAERQQLIEQANAA